MHGEFAEPCASNIGYDFSAKYVRVDGVRAKIHFWDTAGMERFGALYPALYRGCDGIILAYDVTDRQSLERLEHWNREIQEFGPQNVQKVAVGNKSDLESEKEVTLKEAQSVCTELGITHCFQISAKTGDGVKDAMNALLKQIIHRYLRHNQPFMDET